MTKNIAFLFPGQGSQSTGMGLDILAADPNAQERYAEARQILNCSLEELAQPEKAELLSITQYTQPAVYTLSCIIDDILKQNGLSPSYTAGHSAGEYAALTCAGAWDFATGLKVIWERARLMNESKGGGMAAVLGLAPQEVAQVCSEWKDGIVVPANFNSPKQTVISGERTAIEAITPLLKARGAKRVISLPVSGAFHSPLMAEAKKSFTDFLNEISIQSPRIPWISNNTAQAESDPENIRAALVRQFCEPVRWTDTMALVAQSCESAVEVGPGEVLLGLAKACCPDLPFLTTANTAGIQKVKEHYGLSS